MRHFLFAAALGACALSGCASVETPASMSDVDAALAAMNRSMVGTWTGTVERVDPATGGITATSDAFNFTVTDETGLDFAFWRADGLTLSAYQGDGRYRQRSWTAAGALSVDEVRSSGMTGPDANGRWTLTETSVASNDDGATESRTRYVFEPPVLTSYGEERPAGSDAAYTHVSSGEWTLLP